MYICEDCGKQFEDLNAVEGDKSEWFGLPVSEYYYGCPYCGSANWHEMEFCTVCGEWVEELTEADCCPECLKEMEEWLNGQLNDGRFQKEYKTAFKKALHHHLIYVEAV